jgi:hypothetical protein
MIKKNLTYLAEIYAVIHNNISLRLLKFEFVHEIGAFI